MEHLSSQPHTPGDLHHQEQSGSLSIRHQLVFGANPNVVCEREDDRRNIYFDKTMGLVPVTCDRIGKHQRR